MNENTISIVRHSISTTCYEKYGIYFSQKYLTKQEKGKEEKSKRMLERVGKG
jgi:hypothetical protein